MYIFQKTFFVYYSKSWKKYKSMTYTKIKFYIILIWKNFPRMNNKNLTKRGPQGVPLLFLYEVSIVVLIDFIAILLTPGIFLIQILNTNNTNMYLIRFHSKYIIKMRFPKSFIFKVQNHFRHSLNIAAWWNKLHWVQQRLAKDVPFHDFWIFFLYFCYIYIKIYYY